MSEWGPWFSTDRCPNVGTIVQVRAIKKEDMSSITWVGMVTYMRGGILVMDNMPEWPSKWYVDKWRERKPKGLTILESILREVENTRTPEYTAF